MRMIRKGNLAALAILAAFSMNAHAGAFQLFEQNAVALGYFGAGEAAYANDASTNYYNAAGLTLIKHPQIVVSAVDILTSIKFTGTNTWDGGPFGTFSQSGSAQAGGQNFVPSLHFATPLNDRLAFGFSIAPPFGLVTDYPATSFLRYSATKTSLKVIDFSPSLAFAVTDFFSIGAGFDPEYAAAEFDSVVGLPTLNPILDSFSVNKGHSSFNTYGWHAGALLHFNQDRTRIGFNYRSKTDFNLRGYSLLSGRLGPLYNGNLTASLELPATYDFGVYQAITSRLALLGSVIYTKWDVFKNIVINGVASPVGIINVSVPQFYRNTWRFALGAEYQCTPNFLFRFGGGFDQTPTVNQYRGPRLPDGNRIALSVGGQYKINRRAAIDFGYTHLFVANGQVNFPSTAASITSTAVGIANTRADLFGAQLTYSFA